MSDREGVINPGRGGEVKRARAQTADGSASSQHQPLVWAAVAWALGLGAGSLLQTPAEAGSGGLAPAAVIGAAGALALATLAWWRGVRPRALLVIACVSIALAGVGWWSIAGPGAGGPTLGRYVRAEGRLADLSGYVVDQPRVRGQIRDGLGRFMPDGPTSRFIVDVELLHTEAGDVPVDGRLLVAIGDADTRVAPGDHLRLQGWLTGLAPPATPGERDFRATMARIGVVGKFHLKHRGNVHWLDGEMADDAQRPVTDAATKAWHALSRWHRALGDAATASLHAGFGTAHTTAGASRADAIALLDAMLLGRRTQELRELYEAFRRTGLAHLLAISGLHVGVLAMGLWWLVGAVTGRPRLATGIAIIAVIGFLLVVPWRVPVVRASWMIIAALAGLGWARRVKGATIMAVVAMVLLTLRPGDLFDAGFQLSFAIVAALLVFTPRLTERFTRPATDVSVDEQAASSVALTLRRWAVEYLAVSVIAWLVALPIVAYHFHMISPLAVLLTVLAFPLVVALLWLGFVKILAGLVAPAIGAWLAPPLLWLAEISVDAVAVAADTPGTWLSVPPPSALWAAAALMVAVGLLGGAFAGRRAALAACVGLCGGWLFAAPLADAAARWVGRTPALELHMIAVGDGSCFVIRSPDHTLMFDCGSSNYAEIGRYSIIPALAELGIDRIDTLVISHPDFDHFSASLDLADHVRVDRVLTTRTLLAQARDEPDSSTGYLVAGLRRRGITIDTIAAGWQTTLGHGAAAAHVRATWPPAGRTFEHNNDSSIVLRFDAAGRTLLMCGDIQGEAMMAMLDAGLDLDADVTDLPHHGSMPRPPEAGAAWLAAVSPSLVLQSSAEARLRHDKWADLLQGIDRRITAHAGMVTVRISREGQITTQTFR